MLSIQEIQSMSEKELNNELASKNKELLKTMIHCRSTQEKNTSKLGKLRKEIARIKTVLRQVSLSEKKSV